MLPIKILSMATALPEAVLATSIDKKLNLPAGSVEKMGGVRKRHFAQNEKQSTLAAQAVLAALAKAGLSLNDVDARPSMWAAVVKISAYDYAIYGGLEGKVTIISPDTMSNTSQTRANDLKLDPNQVYYRILVQTNNSNLKDRNGKTMPIIPGMVATVDIKTGQKTVFEYLIKPITRMKQALRER